jgi:hypothetical protein
MRALMAETPQTREELIEARDRVRRQIAILECGPVLSRDSTPQTLVLIEQLREILSAVEVELAALE